MQKELAALLEAMTKKRDELNAVIGALSRVRASELRPVVAPPVAAPKRKRYRKMKWTPEHRAKFIAAMEAKRAAKGNGAIPGEHPMPIPEPRADEGELIDAAQEGTARGTRK